VLNGERNDCHTKSSVSVGTQAIQGRGTHEKEKVPLYNDCITLWETVTPRGVDSEEMEQPVSQMVLHLRTKSTLKKKEQRPTRENLLAQGGPKLKRKLKEEIAKRRNRQ